MVTRWHNLRKQMKDDTTLGNKWKVAKEDKRNPKEGPRVVSFSKTKHSSNLSSPFFYSSRQPPFKAKTD